MGASSAQKSILSLFHLTLHWGLHVQENKQFLNEILNHVYEIISLEEETDPFSPKKEQLYF